MVLPVVVVPGSGGAGGGGAGGSGGGVGWLQLHAKRARELKADGPRLVPVHFHQRNVDHYLGTRLVQVIDELLRQQQFIRRSAHHDGALARHPVEFGIDQQVAQRRLNIVQIVLLCRVRQIERLHRLFLQLLALGTSVHRHKDGVGGDRVPKGAGRYANDAQSV